MGVSVYLKPKNVYHEAKNRLMYELIPLLHGNSPKNRFINLGYYSETDSFKVKDDDKENALHLSLYNALLKDLDLKDKDVLEVGCGLGGGAYFLMNYKLVKSYTGVDISAFNIHNNNKYLANNNTSFVRGDARGLPFNNHLFDIVFNLESSHRYGNVVKFYQQVDRVLKPGGFFAYSDIGNTVFFETAEDFFKEKQYQVVRNEDITKEVLQSLDINRENVLKKLNSKKLLFSLLGKKWLKNAVFDKGSESYDKLTSREIIYKILIFKKP